MRAATIQPPEPATSDAQEVHGEHKIEPKDLARIAILGVSAAITWFAVIPRFYGWDLLALAATIICGYPVFEEAISNFLSRRMTMELSMTIALVAALAIQEFFTALIILLFVLIAEMLEELTVDRGRQAIKILLDLLPKQATVRRDGSAADIPIDQVRPGDIVVVKPGGAIPVDGAVVRGHSFVDQSSITGESAAVEKVAGGSVFAGTTNLSGSLDIRAIRLGRDTAFGQIVEAVERAEQSRAPVQRLADRLAGYLVYIALSAALVTFLATGNVRATIAVIIVAGACGIAAGTPLAILGAIGRAAQSGVIIKGGLYVELLGNADTVVLDKTGTLTFGDPRVSGVFPLAGISERTVIEAAAIAERPSEHPLAKAILKKAHQWSLPVIEPDRFEYYPGKGIVCATPNGAILVGSRSILAENGVASSEFVKLPFEDGGSVLVARNTQLLGAIRTEDELRPEAVSAIRELKRLNLRVELVTGDVASLAAPVGRRLGVDQVHAGLLPEQKLEHVEKLIRAGHTVAMVGDGINDAPALSKAHVGVAMGSGTDVARQSADILLLGNNLLDFVLALKTARRCRRVIFTNFIGTLVVDAAGVLLAALGMLNPVLAALIHVVSEMTFILNSARLIPALSLTRAESASEPSAPLAVE